MPRGRKKKVEQTSRVIDLITWPEIQDAMLEAGKKAMMEGLKEYTFGGDIKNVIQLYKCMKGE